MNKPLKDYSDRSLRPYQHAESFKSSATIDTPKVYPKEREEVFAALKYMRTLKDGWNGYTAKAPTSGAIDACFAFFDAFPFGKHYPSKIAPDGEGAVMLIWSTEAHRLTVTVEAALLHPSIEKAGGDEFPDSIPYDMGRVPTQILQYIPRLIVR